MLIGSQQTDASLSICTVHLYLDDEMRNKLQDYILTAHRHYQLTTLLVSHHLPEVLRLADEAILLENGKITAQGNPTDLFAGRTITITIAKNT